MKLSKIFYLKMIFQTIFEDDIPDHLIPQDYVRKVQSKPGCVTESDFPGYRPKGAKDMDLWIESMSQDLSKECPF